MKNTRNGAIVMIVLMVIVVGLLAYMIWAHDWVSVVLLVLISGLFSAVFIGFWHNLKKEACRRNSIFRESLAGMPKTPFRWGMSGS